MPQYYFLELKSRCIKFKQQIKFKEERENRSNSCCRIKQISKVSMSIKNLIDFTLSSASKKNLIVNYYDFYLSLLISFISLFIAKASIELEIYSGEQQARQMNEKCWVIIDFFKVNNHYLSLLIFNWQHFFISLWFWMIIQPRAFRNSVSTNISSVIMFFDG